MSRRGLPLTLEEEIASLLTAKGITIAVAEACTAGRLGHLLTSVPGSSAYFYGGVLAYAQSVKRDLLGVSPELMEADGSVSDLTALAMAQRVRILCDTDIGLSTTGIAGPTGGTPQKPVGLFYVALSAKESYQACRRHLLTDEGRESNRELAARAALALLKEYLLGLP